MIPAQKDGVAWRRQVVKANHLDAPKEDLGGNAEQPTHRAISATSSVFLGEGHASSIEQPTSNGNPPWQPQTR